jgi:hypothetical protein
MKNMYHWQSRMSNSFARLFKTEFSAIDSVGFKRLNLGKDDGVFSPPAQRFRGQEL